MSSFPFTIQEHTIEASHIREYARATSHSQDEKLYLHIKQYTPKDNTSPQKGDVAIIGGHANGFPKVILARQGDYLSDAHADCSTS
jgi:pimeloyl-ACP methyl ester carboxylesterase